MFEVWKKIKGNWNMKVHIQKMHEIDEDETNSIKQKHVWDEKNVKGNWNLKVHIQKMHEIDEDEANSIKMSTMWLQIHIKYWSFLT